MRRSKDPLLRVALMIDRRLARRHVNTDRTERLGALPEACRHLIRTFDLQRRARQKGFHLAAARLEEDLLAAALRVRRAIDLSAHTDAAHPPPLPSPAVVWAEL